MPANKKYLTASPWLRLSKLLAGAAGGYSVMMSLHLFLCQLLPREAVIVTSFFTGYILWAILLLLAFLIPQVWRTWLLYLGLTLLFSLLFLVS